MRAFGSSWWWFVSGLGVKKGLGVEAFRIAIEVLHSMVSLQDIVNNRLDDGVWMVRLDQIGGLRCWS